MQMKMSGSSDKGVTKYRSNMELKKSLIEVMGLGFFFLYLLQSLHSVACNMQLENGRLEHQHFNTQNTESFTHSTQPQSTLWQILGQNHINIVTKTMIRF